MKRALILAALLAAAFLPRAAGAATTDVTITAGGFSPSLVTITAGDTVRWTNNDTVSRNISSNPHPVHTDYPPLNIGDFGPGQQRSLTFSTAGTYGYHDHNNSSQGGTITVQAASGGGGSGGSTAKPSSAVLIRPNGGEVLDAGTRYDIFWQADGTGLVGIRLSLSLDGGATYAVIADNEFHDGIHSWTVADNPSTKARFKIEALGQGGTVLAGDASDADVQIRGTQTAASTPTTTTTTGGTTAPAQETTPAATTTTPAPATIPQDATRTGEFTPSSATTANPSIDADKELVPATAGQTPPCVAGSLIKSSVPAVYYCGQNGKRYYFPNEGVYRTWYPDFKSVQTVSDAALAAIPFGGTVTYRPGVRLVKLQTDPKTYAVARGGTLRWVSSEAKAAELYGSRWNRNIDIVSDSFFATYTVGEPIE